MHKARRPAWWARGSGPMSQPRRQPVMACDLETTGDGDGALGHAGERGGAAVLAGRRRGWRRPRRRPARGRARRRQLARAASSSAVATAPVGLLGEFHRMARVRGVRARLQVGRVEVEAVLGAERDRDEDGTGGGDSGGVGDVGGLEDDHLVAGVDQALEGREEGALGAGKDDHLVRGDLLAGEPRVLGGDGGAQRRLARRRRHSGCGPGRGSPWPPRRWAAACRSRGRRR